MMNCAAIVIALAESQMSMLSISGIPVQVCTYKVGTEAHVERQIGFFCTDKPKKEIKQKTLMIAQHNACAASK